MRVLVTGPRDWTDWLSILKAFSELSIGFSPREITLVEGEAEGFDSLSRTVAEGLGWKIDPYPVPTWYPDGKYDPEAGHRRNQVMVDSGADIALAGFLPCVKRNCKRRPSFHGTHGTADAVKKIRAAHIPLHVIRGDQL